MSIEETIEEMKTVQRSLLDFLENESDFDDNSESLFKILDNDQTINDKHEFESLLRLINIIGNQHQQVNNFITKIEQIILHFKNNIQNSFTNAEIFEIFKNNKRILLFLIEEQILTIDEFIVSQITNDKFVKMKYAEYFSPEIKPFLTTNFIAKYNHVNKSLQDLHFIDEITKDVSNNFYENRKEGQNDNYLCELIRLDKIDEFIVFINQRNLSLNSFIPESIFETNNFLLWNSDIKLIDYAAFFGSIRIIKYIHIKGIELPSSMWMYSIHSNNAELITFLEENNVLPNDGNYESILEESIFCHHNDISNHIIDNLIKKDDLEGENKEKFILKLNRYSTMYYNYDFFPDNVRCKSMFYYFSIYGYYKLVNLFMNDKNIIFYINASLILKILILNDVQNYIFFINMYILT